MHGTLRHLVVTMVDGNFFEEHVGSVKVVEDNGSIQRETEGPVVKGDLTEDAAVVLSGFADYWSDIEEHLHRHTLRLALGQEQSRWETVDLLLVFELRVRLESLDHAVVVLFGGLLVVGSEVEVITDDQVLAGCYCWEKKIMYIMRSKNNTTIKSIFCKCNGVLTVSDEVVDFVVVIEIVIVEEDFNTVEIVFRSNKDLDGSHGGFFGVDCEVVAEGIVIQAVLTGLDEDGLGILLGVGKQAVADCRVELLEVGCQLVDAGTLELKVVEVDLIVFVWALVCVESKILLTVSHCAVGMKWKASNKSDTHLL